jgi:hypothetical protein
VTTMDILCWAVGAFVVGLMVGHKFLPPRRNATQDHESETWMKAAIAAHGRYIKATNPEALQAWKNFVRYTPPDVILVAIFDESEKP